MPKDSASVYRTPFALWQTCISWLYSIVDMSKYDAKVDPCAGSGDLDKIIPGGVTFMSDLDPENNPNVKRGDMTKLNYNSFGKSVAIISNPPFNSSAKPIYLLNQIAKYENVTLMAFIFPDRMEEFPKDTTFYSSEVLDTSFHLVASMPIPADTKFVNADGMEVKITAALSFQIWVRRDEKRVDENKTELFCMDMWCNSPNPDLLVCLPNAAFVHDVEMEQKTKKSFKRTLKYSAVLPASKKSYKALVGRSVVAITLNRKVTRESIATDLELAACAAVRAGRRNPQDFGPGVLIRHLRRLERLGYKVANRVNLGTHQMDIQQER